MVLLLGAGTGTSGLMPPLLSSVAPSGIVPPFRVLDTAPGLDSGDAVPLDETPAAVVQPGVAPIVPVAPVVAIGPVAPLDPIDPAVPKPPPSKVELMPVVPANPEAPVPAVSQLSPGVVVKPPGLISIAPRGRPVGLLPVAALEPRVPRGEVIPSAGVVVVSPEMPGEVCAKAAPPLSNSAAAISEYRRIGRLLGDRLA